MPKLTPKTWLPACLAATMALAPSVQALSFEPVIPNIAPRADANYLSKEDVLASFKKGQLWCFDAVDDQTCSWTDVNLGARDEHLTIVTTQTLEPGVNLHIALELSWIGDNLCVLDYETSHVEVTLQADFDNRLDIENVTDAPDDIVDVIKDTWDDTTGGRCFRYVPIKLTNFEGTALRQDMYTATGELERISVLRVLPEGTKPYLGAEGPLEA